MQASTIHSIQTMTAVQWFDLLNSLEQQDEGKSYVYQVEASEFFTCNNVAQTPGTYFLRTTENPIPSKGCRVRKLSFPQIVFFSDVVTRGILKGMEYDIEKFAKIGDASRSIENDIASTKSLENMQQKVWTKYYEKGFMGIVRRFLSAIANFFRKYNLYVETGIYWPGSSCNYADKVIRHINKIKKPFIDAAFTISKSELSSYLGLSVDELEKKETEELNKLYKKQVFLFHPDKNLHDPAAVEQFKKINRVWNDFKQLSQLKIKVDLSLSGEKPSLPEEEESRIVESPSGVGVNESAVNEQVEQSVEGID